MDYFQYIFQSIEQLPYYYIAITAIIFGACVGSFLNVIIIRLPNDLFRQHHEAIREYYLNNQTTLSNATSIEQPLVLETQHESYIDNIPPFFSQRSQCIHCKNQLKWHENIPIFSYIAQKAHCRYCHKKISFQYFFIEALTALLFLLLSYIAYKLPLSYVSVIPLMILLCALICASLIDFSYKILPDEITLPVLWLGLLINIFNTYTSLSDAVIGAVVGYLSLWILYKIHFFVTHREGLGYGDFKLTAMLGAWFGWYSLAPILFISSILGIIFFIIQKCFYNKHSKNLEIPFGPFLSIGALIFSIWLLIFNLPIP